MKLKKIALGALAALVVAGTAGWFSLDKETRALLKTAPTNRDLLFWSVPQRDAAFRALDRISLLGQVARHPGQQRAQAAAAGRAAQAPHRPGRLHGQPAQRCHRDPAGRQAARRALRAGL
ncbi:MAG: hypothetical protein V9G23_01195 [Giesbergeria sp.]